MVSGNPTAHRYTLMEIMMQLIDAKTGRYLATCATLDHAVAMAAKLVQADPLLVVQIR